MLGPRKKVKDKDHFRTSACTFRLFLGSEQNVNKLYLQYCNILLKTNMLCHAEIQIVRSRRSKKASSKFKKIYKKLMFVIID